MNLWNRFASVFKVDRSTNQALRVPVVLKQGPAKRVVFFYSGEEGTYVENVHVILYENGIVRILSENDEATTHVQNCEILWRAGSGVRKPGNLRLLDFGTGGAHEKPDNP